MKTFQIDAYELLEARGDGVSENCVALVAHESVAQAWAEGNPYRRYRKVDQIVFIYETHRELEDSFLRVAKEKAMAKLTPEERVLLGLPADGLI